MTPGAQRRPAEGAVTVRPPGSEDNPHRTEVGRHPGASVAADGYSAGTLDRWQRARDRALGGRLVLHRDPERAADLLAEALGGRGAARAWVLALSAEVGR